MPTEAEAEVIAAEHEMFAEVLSEVFLGVLAEYEPQEWCETAVHRLSRGAAPKLLGSLVAAHAAGMRMDPRAAALAEAIELLCDPDRKRTGPYDFPTTLSVLVVTRETANAVHGLTRSGIYTNADDVVGTAMHALEWAENDPEGKRRLLQFALEAGLDDEAGRTIPADVVFARARERAQRVRG
ncbi:MAG TPA: hypothetical protein VFJ82_15125 [Longimicrobium sp.]|nr:hypothetical protein [Longimicrobium sp.]